MGSNRTMKYIIYQYSKSCPNGREYASHRAKQDINFQDINFVHAIADRWTREDRYDPNDLYYIVMESK